jgi:RNA methyltransferase, TrmH family
MLVKSKTKYIQSLGEKKFREKEGVFVAEGPKLVKELLKAEVGVYEIYAVKEWLDENKKFIKSIDTIEITKAELKGISFMTTPQSVLALVRMPSANTIVTEGKIILALDAIQDPGNLGTIIRTADWFGVQHIICSEDCADVYNPKVVQATMGSIARVNVIYTDLYLWLQKEKGIRIYAAVLRGKDLKKIKIKAGVILIGNESKGIRPEILGLANEKITIPGIGKAESLNAAVATGIVLSHCEFES